MSSQYPIEDKTVAKIAIFLSIDNVNIVPFSTCNWNACLIDALGAVIDCKNLTMTPEEYAAWGNNDDYLIQLTCQKMDVVLKPSSS